MTKHLHKFLLTAAVLLCAVSVSAHDVEVDGVYYNLNADVRTASVTYEGTNSYSAAYSGEVVIPASITVDGVPYTVTNIGEHAFFYCYDLTSVAVPSSVTGVAPLAFRDCRSLTAITVSPDNAAYCSEDGVLYDKAKDTLLVCPGAKTGAVTIPSGVAGIADCAFQGCKGLTSIAVPSSVTSIGVCAFQSCESVKVHHAPLLGDAHR